jgi:hypothetical protein
VVEARDGAGRGDDAARELIAEQDHITKSFKVSAEIRP